MPDHRSPRPWRALAGALVVIAAQLIPAGVAQAEAPGTIEVQISATMADRFGLDANSDGRIDLPNTPAYAAAAHPWECDPRCPEPRFTVELAGSVLYEGADVPLRPLEYRWAIDVGTSDAINVSKGLPGVSLDLTEGEHEVRLTVIYDVPWGTAAVGTTDQIEVEDLLIVAIGDSYISGEGNPEFVRADGADEAVWGDGVGNDEVEADHAAAHRSTVSWAARAALAMERSDPTTSVTFLFVAAAGATVDKGLVGPQNSKLPAAQVDRIAGLVGDRSIDMLLVSIGGNDIGFSYLIKELVDADPLLDPLCYRTDLANVWESVSDGQWNRRSRISFGEGWFGITCRSARIDGGRSVAGMQQLPAELDRLALAISPLDPAAVYLMEYPDPTGRNEGICDEIVEDAAPFGLHEINGSEQRLGQERVLEPLNTRLSEAAARHGWVMVGGVAEAFTAGHGYCAPWPDYGYPDGYQSAPAVLRNRYDYPSSWYRNPGRADELPGQESASWYRTAGQSAALQGPDSRTETTGTMHPNELGHLAMAALLLDHLESR